MADRTLAEQEAPSLASVAGEYYQGDGTGVNLTLKIEKSGTFSFVWEGCMGTYGAATGNAEMAGDILKLQPSSPQKPNEFGSMEDREFHPLRWGERLYLIPTGKVVEFCNAVNLGGEPRNGNWGRFYLREKDWERKVHERPPLPANYTQYLLPAPVRGRIVEVADQREAWVNLGKKDGLLPEMELVAQRFGKSWGGFLTVKSVEAGRCRVRLTYEDDSRLHVGQTVTSTYGEKPAR